MPEYVCLNWEMVPSIDRVYVNELARRVLGWEPRYDFRFLVERLRLGKDTHSPLARLIGSKGYHPEHFVDGPYPEKVREPAFGCAWR